MKNGELIGEMIAWESGCPRRIDHFLKVYGLAKAIASREQLSSTTMNLVETAAILHDIGIRPSLEKYGTSTGPQDDAFIERVCWLIGHHHTYQDVHDIDHQILIEADFLVNLEEKKAPQEQILRVLEDHFKTATGKQFLHQMLLAQAPQL